MSFSLDGLLATLPVMLWGMLGIFVIIGIIIVLTVLLQKIFKPKKK